MLVSTKPPRCQQCRKRLDKPGLRIHEECVDAFVARIRAEKAERLAKKERQIHRDRREAIKTVPELIAAADRVFMAWVRERDRQAGQACISSGRPLDWSGNQVDAGHYRSRGAASHLRYDPRNCHAQSKYENRHRAGNAVEYRIRLIERIGLAEVEALEADNTPHKWTREELREIATTYREKLKRLKAQTA